MTITQHGPSCDVCDGYILLEPELIGFAIFGVENLHCHAKCKPLILALDTKVPHFWRGLPNGRVRQLADAIHERDSPTCKHSLQVQGSNND